jgi:hypothetical protein
MDKHFIEVKNKMKKLYGGLDIHKEKIALHTRFDIPLRFTA